jgi:hypothetical protein
MLHKKKNVKRFSGSLIFSVNADSNADSYSGKYLFLISTQPESESRISCDTLIGMYCMDARMKNRFIALFTLTLALQLFKTHY